MPESRNRITAELVVKEIRQIAQELGRSPTRDEFEERARFSRMPVITHFGGWNAALKAAGLPPSRVHLFSPDELLAELRRVAAITERSPMQADFRAGGVGKCDSRPFARAFGSFSGALVAAGFTPKTEKNVSIEKLMAEIERVANLLGHPPTLRDFEQYGCYGTATYVRRFGSWNEALTKAGWESHLGRGIAVIASDGREYDSYGEAEVANVLHEALRVGKISSYSPKVAISKGRRWTCDFLVTRLNGEDMYVEYDGFGNKRPQESYGRSSAKIHFYQRRGLPLTIVSPHVYVPTYGRLFSLKDFRLDLLGSVEADCSPFPKRIQRKSVALMLNELRRVAEKLGHTPYKREFAANSNLSPTAWKTWNQALVAANLKPRLKRNISNEDLLLRLVRLSESLGKTPTKEDIAKAHFSTAIYWRRFGGLNEALRLVGMKPSKLHRVTKDVLLNSLRELAGKLQRTPNKADMDSFGDFSGQTYFLHFGSWAEACREAGLAPNRADNVPSTKLLEELRRLKRTLGRPPKMTDMRKLSSYRFTVYQSRFGSWRKALRQAGVT